MQYKASFLIMNESKPEIFHFGLTQTLCVFRENNKRRTPTLPDLKKWSRSSPRDRSGSPTLKGSPPPRATSSLFSRGAQPFVKTASTSRFAVCQTSEKQKENLTSKNFLSKLRCCELRFVCTRKTKKQGLEKRKGNLTAILRRITNIDRGWTTGDSVTFYCSYSS